MSNTDKIVPVRRFDFSVYNSQQIWEMLHNELRFSDLPSWLRAVFVELWLRGMLQMKTVDSRQAWKTKESAAPLCPCGTYRLNSDWLPKEHLPMRARFVDYEVKPYNALDDEAATDATWLAFETPDGIYDFVQREELLHKGYVGTIWRDANGANYLLSASGHFRTLVNWNKAPLSMPVGAYCEDPLTEPAYPESVRFRVVEH